jgi:hypothetical protein
MGNLLSEVPTNFDEYIRDDYKNYPPMTVSIYKGRMLQETFEAPSGFDFHRFVDKNRPWFADTTDGSIPREFGIIVDGKAYRRISKHDRKELEISCDGKSYRGIYKIDNDIRHYISDELKTPPMRIVVYDNCESVYEFDAPSGFDLKAYATRLPGATLFPGRPSPNPDIVRVSTYNGREYIGYYERPPVDIKEPE